MQEPGKLNQASWALRATLGILQWTIILSAVVALFYILKLTIPSSQDVTRRLNDCLGTKSQRGQYSLDDDGRSAEALLDQCSAETDKWTTWCQLYSKDDDRTICAVKAVALAQSAIKKFNK